LFSRYIVYRFLFVFVFVRLRLSPLRIKLAASKFCTVVHRRPGQEISNFCQLCSPRSPKSNESASHREVKFTVHILSHRKRHAIDAPFVEYRAACARRSACLDIGHSPLTYLFSLLAEKDTFSSYDLEPMTYHIRT